MKQKGFKEAYTVRYKFQKPDGFWTTVEETVFVRCAYGEIGKDNHAAAELAILNKHPKAQILAVIYQ